MARTAKMHVVRRRSNSEQEVPVTVESKPAKPDAAFGLNSIPDRVAGSKVHYRNWEVPGAKEAFPFHMGLRFVERMYPYSKPEPLLVDCPMSEYEEKDCDKKAEVFRTFGFRYLILKRNMSFEEALQQLGESHELDNR